MEQHAPAYTAAWGLRMPEHHAHALHRIMACRTEAAGRIFYQCPQCDDWHVAPASCGHRACNACGHEKARQWQARQEARLLPVDYLLITFTIPAEFRSLFRSAQELCYDLLFKTAAAVLRDIAADPKHLGGDIGMTGVLHTWTRDLRYHPHIHFIVPAGALKNGQWIDPRRTAEGEDFFLPVKVLSTVMRNAMLKALPGALTDEQRRSLPAGIWRKRWNVHIQRAGQGDTALGYLARYVQQSAIDVSRIVHSDPAGVTIRWTDRNTGLKKTQKLTGQDFMHRFLQHVLPRGFTRVRHFGFLSAAARKTYAQVQAALAGRTVKQATAAPAGADSISLEAAQGMMNAAVQAGSDGRSQANAPEQPLPHNCCPRCRVKMTFVEYWHANRTGRGPPEYIQSQRPGKIVQMKLNLQST